MYFTQRLKQQNTTQDTKVYVFRCTKNNVWISYFVKINTTALLALGPCVWHDPNFVKFKETPVWQKTQQLLP